MTQAAWDVSADRGFLIQPDPLVSLVEHVQPPHHDAVRALHHAVDSLPGIMGDGSAIDGMIAALPALDVAALALDDVQRERLFQLYAFLATACVYGDPTREVKYLPSVIARPFVALADQVERPPMFSYTSFVLANWRRVDPSGDIVIDNLDTLNTFTGLPDERWFALIHVDVEARAADALAGAMVARAGVAQADAPHVETGLKALAGGLRAMTKTFRRMRSGCDPDVYYHHVRPYNFGFIDVVFADSRFGAAPQNFRGGSGAQSSVIPALIAALGIEHESTDLMVHLGAMRAYMPRQHRAFIDQMAHTGIRAYVQRVGQPALTEIYNDCLRAVTLFRQLHLSYARLYIFERGDPVGTGGTPFMDWLNKLIDETEKHYL
jgi:indoleamine 2,3-dioxygenase